MPVVLEIWVTPRMIFSVHLCLCGRVILLYVAKIPCQLWSHPDPGGSQPGPVDVHLIDHSNQSQRDACKATGVRHDGRSIRDIGVVAMQDLVYVGRESQDKVRQEDRPANHTRLAMFPGNPDRREEQRHVYGQVCNLEVDDILTRRRDTSNRGRHGCRREVSTRRSPGIDCMTQDTMARYK